MQGDYTIYPHESKRREKLICGNRQILAYLCICLLIRLLIETGGLNKGELRQDKFAWKWFQKPPPVLINNH